MNNKTETIFYTTTEVKGHTYLYRGDLITKGRITKDERVTERPVYAIKITGQSTAYMGVGGEPTPILQTDGASWWRDVEDITKGDTWYRLKTEEVSIKPALTVKPVTLLDVADAIEANEANYNQGSWGYITPEMSAEGDEVTLEVTLDEETKTLKVVGPDGTVRAEGEECGTTACVCGWTVMLANRARMRLAPYGYYGDAVTEWFDPITGDEIEEYQVQEMGGEILGLSSTEGHMLFGGGWRPPTGVSVPAALRLIHHGLLPLQEDYAV